MIECSACCETKEPSRNNLADLGGARPDLVVPVTVKLIASDIDLFEFLIGGLDAGLGGFRVDLGMPLEASWGCYSCDETHDRLETSQRFAPPVLANVGKETMLDPVPLAGAGRKMTDDDPQAGLVGQFLQLQFPKA